MSSRDEEIGAAAAGLITAQSNLIRIARGLDMSLHDVLQYEIDQDPEVPAQRLVDLVFAWEAGI